MKFKILCESEVNNSTIFFLNFCFHPKYNINFKSGKRKFKIKEKLIDAS